MRAVQQRFHAYPIQTLIPWWIAGPCAAALATAVSLVSGMNATGASALYVLSVLLAVSVAKLKGALLASAISFFCLNYFFTPPRGTFLVEKGEDLVALVVFLAVAVVVSGLFSSVSALAVERRVLDEQARNARLESEASNLRAAMFSAVTHDLKSPITSIKVSVDSLLNQTSQLAEEDARALLEGIASETDRLTRLVTNVLDLARFEAGAMQPNLVEADILELLGVVLKRMSSTINGHPLEVKAESDLPEVRVDVVQMEHILTNLVENAVCFSSAGSPIELLITATDRAVEIQIVDHGPGVPPEERERVMDPFYRMDRDRSRGGSGLGLAIVQAMISAQGGTFRLQETSGGGATAVASVPTA